MKASDQLPEQIDDDGILAPLQQHFTMQPPAELDQRVKQAYRESLGQQQATQEPVGDEQLSSQDGIHVWKQRIQACMQFFQQAPAAAGSLVATSLLVGLLSGLVMPLLWQTEQTGLTPANTDMVLRNGQPSSVAQTSSIASNAELSAEQWLEVIAELLVQQRVDEAHLQLQAFRQRYPSQKETLNKR